MTFTIYETCKIDRFITVGTKHSGAEEVYSNFRSKNNKVFLKWHSWDRTVLIDIPKMDFVEILSELSSFVNNELGEECLFEVE